MDISYIIKRQREATPEQKRCMESAVTASSHGDSLSRQDSNKRYDQSDLGKETRMRYNQSDLGKESRKRYNQSDLGKESRKSYMICQATVVDLDRTILGLPPLDRKHVEVQPPPSEKEIRDHRLDEIALELKPRVTTGTGGVLYICSTSMQPMWRRSYSGWL